jgi:FkbM family methyltransferase
MKILNLISVFINKISYEGNISYSQNGEDLVLNRIFDGFRAEGFYVDIGAHHPTRFSNTYLFYLKGWRGINIDAQPGSMVSFIETRPRDINLETGVGTSIDKMLFYQFNEPALNTFNLVEADSKVSITYKRDKGTLVDVRSLNNILKEHVSINQKIDFMSIDVEGNELDVIKSNDWNLFRPNYLLIEILRASLEDALNHPVTAFLANYGYIPVSKVFDTIVYELKK